MQMQAFFSLSLLVYASAARCQQDTIHCSFSRLLTSERRRLSSSPPVDNFCLSEELGTVDYHLNGDHDRSSNYNLLQGLLNKESIPMPPVLYIRKGNVVDANEVQYLVAETNDTKTVQWIVAKGLHIMYRAKKTSSVVSDYQIPVDTDWDPTLKSSDMGALNGVKFGICPTLTPTLAPTAEPTVMPTKAPTPDHPCKSGSHTCDDDNGRCVRGASESESMNKTVTDHAGYTYHCTCNEGYIFIDGSDPTANKCSATVSPTASPTQQPTSSPTSSPTTQPTKAPTAPPTPAPTLSPTHVGVLSMVISFKSVSPELITSLKNVALPGIFGVTPHDVTIAQRNTNTHTAADGNGPFTGTTTRRHLQVAGEGEGEGEGDEAFVLLDIEIKIPNLAFYVGALNELKDHGRFLADLEAHLESDGFKHSCERAVTDTTTTTNNHYVCLEEVSEITSVIVAGTNFPTKSPTPLPTAAPTTAPTAHPCDGGEHGCDRTPGGKCHLINPNDATDVTNGLTYMCGCAGPGELDDYPLGFTCTSGCEAEQNWQTNPTNQTNGNGNGNGGARTHTCTESTPPPTQSPTTQPTPAPTPVHPCSKEGGVNSCDPVHGGCVEGANTDTAMAHKDISLSVHRYHCTCNEDYQFADPQDARNNACAEIFRGETTLLVGDDDLGIATGGVSAASASTGASVDGGVAAAAVGGVGSTLLVVALIARRKREEEEEEDEEEGGETKRRRIVWSDSMEQTEDHSMDDSDAKAAAQAEALQMGVAMGVAMANKKADSDGLYNSSSNSRSRSGNNRMSAALLDVRLDDSGDGTDPDGLIPAWMMTGWVVDRKEIEYLSELGQGAFGAVSLVRVRGTLMAAKQLNPDAEHEEEKRTELLKEVKAMAELQHTNVVRIFGVCMDPGHTCVLMEFASNGTVRDMLDKAQKEGAPLPTYALFKLMRDVVLGMRHAHAHENREGVNVPILHRDLKAANILLTENHTALVADFGLATDNDDGELESGGGGTLAYSPPEVLVAMAKNADDSAWSPEGDVYSFGVLAWELVTGKVPYTGYDAKGLYNDVVNKGKRCHGGKWDEEVSVSATPSSECDPFLASVIKRAWAQNREDRPSFKELSEEFEEMSKKARFQTPDNVYSDLDSLVNSRTARNLMETLQGLEQKENDVKVDVEQLLAQEEAKYEAGRMSHVEKAKKDSDEGKNVLTDTFANFYSDVFGNNKADDDDDDLEAMV